jgi:hypothetical protein
MAEVADPAADIRAWMVSVLKQTGLTPAGWAKKAGVAGSTVQRAIKPDYAFITSSRTLSKLAQAAGTAPPEVRRPAEIQLVPKFLPVRYRVQAGHWLEVDDYAQTFVSEFSHPVSPDPRFSDWPQWLEEVVGDSVNLKIAPGGLAHVVDAIDMGYSPRDGDWVVVERRRAGGMLRERTIKQVAVRPDGVVELWPRSSNPKWTEPLNLSAGSNGDEPVEVEIVGLVIGAYSPFA